MKTNQPSSARSMEYWRSLEHLADTPEMREMIGKEFPGYDVDEMLGGSRRKFLKMVGASMALAGLTLSGCRRWPEEKLAPFSTNARDRMPGVPEQYATAMEMGGVAQPLLVTSYDGRPIKIEGNPSHPFSLTIKDKIGSADAYAQASLLEMYDPDRSDRVYDNSEKPPLEPTWVEFKQFLQMQFGGMTGNGKGIVVLSEATSGPAFEDVKKRFQTVFPNSQWFEYEPVSRDNEIDGAKLAFGVPVRTMLHLDKAQTVVLLDADVLGTHPAHVRYAADWVKRRRTADAEKPEMSRVYMAESGFSLTGSNADVRLPVSPARLYAVAHGIAERLGVTGLSAPAELDEGEKQFVEAAAADLKAAGKSGVLAAGGMMPPIGHALVHAINEKIGAIGQTVTLLDDPTVPPANSLQSIIQLAGEIKGGQINTLIILGGNPVYDAPVDLGFGDLITKHVPTSIHLSLYNNETSLSCRWNVPRAHYLETWGDARAWDGTAGIVQPLIQPLYGGLSPIELLSMIAGDSVIDGHELVKRAWSAILPKGTADLPLRKVIERGFQPGTQFKPAQTTLASIQFPAVAAAPDGFFLCFRPDSHVYDGRFANNGWLQETPDPLTKLIWDNAALISKKDADELGITTGTKLAIQLPDRSGGYATEIAAYVMPGHPVGAITLPLGYGRRFYGRQDTTHLGDNLGFDVCVLRTTESLSYSSGAKVTRGSGDYLLVSTQDHYILDSIGAEGTAKRIGPRNESGMIIHEATLAEFKKDPESVHGNGKKRRIGLQLFQEPIDLSDNGDPNRRAWGMAIDMNACIGCNACALACQSENNIPVVGKVQANMHRSMNWIRIDRYFKGDVEDPNIEVVYQPMMCQQCENAPCEEVCPVGATVHDTEGINTMVYNRCIGTRYCSNNCPYKVRRFNYLDYQNQNPRGDWAEPYLNLPDQQANDINKIKRMVFNPEVSVRMRGVMEKCTYCVQRIHRTTIAKRAAGEDLKDGDIITACQQACPTQAIVFGDLNDKQSKVSKLHQNNRTYAVLQEELDTRPRTQYLAKIRNVEGEKA